MINRHQERKRPRRIRIGDAVNYLNYYDSRDLIGIVEDLDWNLAKVNGVWTPYIIVKRYEIKRHD